MDHQPQDHQPQTIWIISLKVDGLLASEQRDHRPHNRWIISLKIISPRLYGSSATEQMDHQPQNREIIKLRADGSSASEQMYHQPQSRWVISLRADGSSASEYMDHQPQSEQTYHQLGHLCLQQTIYAIILLKSVCRSSQTTGRNSCSIVSGDVANCSYRLSFLPLTSLHLSSA